MFVGAVLVTAALAVCQTASAAIAPNTGAAAAHLSIVRRFGSSLNIDWLQFLDNILAAVLIARARPIAGAVQIDADPTLVRDLLQNAMAGGEIDVPIAQIVDALEELRFGRILLVHLAV